MQSSLSDSKTHQPDQESLRFLATRDDVSGQVLLLTTGDFQAHFEFIDHFRQSLQPVGAVEQQLVQSMAHSAWKMNQYRALADQIMTHRAMSRIHRMDHPGNNPQIAETVAVAEAASEITRDLANLSLCESRSFKMFKESHKMLLEIQAHRKEQEDIELSDAQALLSLHEEEQEKQQTQEQPAGKAEAQVKSQPPYAPVPYDPKKDGFVFSIDEIKAYRDREKRITEARRTRAAA